MAQIPGIFCLEGDWRGDLTDRTSVKPQLQMLENMRHCGGLIHRDVATRAEFEHYAKKWSQKKYKSYSVGYMAFHGSPTCLELGVESLSLTDMAEVLAGRLENRILYFGSCLTLAASDEELRRFCAVTKARAIAGYTRTVDWLETAAFDFILLPRLLALNDGSYLKPIFTSLSNDHPRFVHGLGFRMATTKWATDVKIARHAARLEI